MFFSKSDYKIPTGQPMYSTSTPTPSEPPKFTVKEVLKAYNALEFPDLNQSTIDKITQYLLDEEDDEYSEYIRLKEKFDGVKSVEPEPVQTPTREPTGYQYTDGTPICFGDKIEYELPRPLYNILPTIIYGEVIKVFPYCGFEYDFHVDLKGVSSLNSPTLKSIVETATHIKKVA